MIWIILACVLSAILYRAGGMGKEYTTSPQWIPMWMRNTKARDLGCPTVLLMLVFITHGFDSTWWCYLLFFGLSFASLTTYWDFMFGYDNYWFHGFMCGISALPLLWCGVGVLEFIIRIIICTVGMGLWSKYANEDYVEEWGRGAFFIA